MMNQEKNLGFFVCTVAVVGILQLLNHLIFSHMKAAHTPVGLILDVIGLILVVWAGRSSKMVNGHPAGRGALLGAIYGAISYIRAFFIPAISMNEMNKYSTTPELQDQMQFAADLVNSTGFHVVLYVIAGMWFALLGLIIGAIGGATIKK